MGTAKKRRPAKKTKKNTSFLDRLPKTELAYWEMMARKDQEQIKGDGSSLDALFEAQKARALKKVEALKAAK